jgi:ring-1,2-phenylacetyl-CoA epoxidase subunit PaaD
VVIANAELLDILREVKDPELPALDIVELGIVRSVEAIVDRVIVEITPTYSGCPALKMIEDEIVVALRGHGYPNVTVTTRYSPAWSTDWLSDATKEKLRQAGIAPPHAVEVEPLITLSRARHTVECPYCGSANTEERSEFGSTACKAIHFCKACRQPFDRFKTL